MKTENCLPSWQCGEINSVHESNNNNLFIQDLLQEVELNRTQFSYIIQIFYTDLVQNIVMTI